MNENINFDEILTKIASLALKDVNKIIAFLYANAKFEDFYKGSSESYDRLLTLLDTRHQLATWFIPLKRYNVFIKFQVPDEFKAKIFKIKQLLETADLEINGPQLKYLPRPKTLFKKKHGKSLLFKDYCFWKTGLHHFHLSNNGERTNNLLFVTIDDNQAVFLKIGNHDSLQERHELHSLREKHGLGSRRAYFPRLPTVDPEHQWTEQQVNELAAAGVTTFSCDEHNPPYLDYPQVTSGHSLAAVVAVSIIKEKIYRHLLAFPDKSPDDLDINFIYNDLITKFDFFLKGGL